MDKKQLKDILQSELEILVKLSKLTKSFDELLEIYADKYPKKCNSCGKMYVNRDQYLKETIPTRERTSVYEEGQVCEFRNCECHTTLLIITPERRDTSEFGVARRELFVICMNKAAKHLNAQAEDIEPALRELFLDVIKEHGSAEALEEMRKGEA